MIAAAVLAARLRAYKRGSSDPDVQDEDCDEAASMIEAQDAALRIARHALQLGNCTMNNRAAAVAAIRKLVGDEQ